MKYLMSIILLFISVITLAQVNTGGPDFDAPPLEITVVKEGFPRFKKTPGEVIPAVVYDSSMREYKVLAGNDLEAIIRSHRPRDMEHLMHMMSDSRYFISTPLGQDHVVTNFYAVKTPNVAEPEIFNEDLYGLHEIFSYKIGYPIPIFVFSHQQMALEDVFLAAYRLFSQNTHKIVYVPVRANVW